MKQNPDSTDHSVETLTLLRNFLGEEEMQRMLEGKGKREADIMRSAIALFAEKGFEATTTKEIAKEAGIAEGTIFRYFKTKSDILLSVFATSIVRAASPRVFNPVTKILQQKDKTTRAILKELIQDRIKLLKSNLPLLTVLVTEIQYRPQLKNIWIQEFPMRGLNLMEAFIKERMEAGEFRCDIHPRQTAAYLAGMVGVSALLDFNLDSDSIAWLDDASIDSILDLFLSGIAKGGASNE